jgi:predicted esterase
MTRSFLVLILIGAAIVSNAQPSYHFTKGLAVPDCHRYGREALVTDQLAYQLYTGQLKTPVENGKLFTNNEGKDIIWKNIEVDSTGRFRGDLLGNGYIYLTYQSKSSQNVLLNTSANSMVYFNGEPHGGDIYSDGWVNIPVKLKKGVNELLIRCGNFSRWQGVSAKLIFPAKDILLSADDATLPHIVVGKSNENLWGAVVVINGSDKILKNLTIAATINGNVTTTNIPEIPQRTMRKIGFSFSPSGVKAKGDQVCLLALKQNAKLLDEEQITITAVDPKEHQSHTFVSKIDGSVQYYSVAPPTRDIEKPALFLSVHGAGVQAIGQARAYRPKDWGVLVAATNRRPRGFNWEDWGRMDALEVLALAKKKFDPDPNRIYLTGHSMGGHGTWYLGSTYPDQWAAIAPCAAYPTLTGYGSADGRIPDQAHSEEEKVLLRASNPSNVVELAPNYKGLGVYIFHGDDDRVVSVEYARQMRKVLGEFHNDFSYYEYPGGSHWFGNESVDWPPLFDFFKWHKIEHDTTFDNIEFVTANPAISSQYRWASVIQQNSPLDYSKFQLARNRSSSTITGTTENVFMIKLKTDFVKPGDSISITLDSVLIRTVVNEQRELWLSGFPDWKVVSKVDSRHKNPLRSGAFKEGFNNNMVFIYGTHGTKEENRWAYNKARYDAEVWYYRGNGSVDVIADDAFASQKFRDRGLIIYGNATTNSAWSKLLKNCVINVTADRITVGQDVFKGKDLGAYFTWPREDSDVAMIAVISGTGLLGMKATDANQYFAAGSGFPDYLIFSAEMLSQGAKGIRTAGFFDNEWSLSRASRKTK